VTINSSQRMYMNVVHRNCRWLDKRRWCTTAVENSSTPGIDGWNGLGPRIHCHGYLSISYDVCRPNRGTFACILHWLIMCDKENNGEPPKNCSLQPRKNNHRLEPSWVGKLLLWEHCISCMLLLPVMSVMTCKMPVMACPWNLARESLWSLKMAPFDKSHTSSYWRSTVLF